MAVYDGDKTRFLDQSLRSLLNQDLKAKEVIIVKDGYVRKDICDIIKKYKKDLNIIEVQIPINVGLAMALNEGLKYCQYDYIARMDADDICKHNRLIIQEQFLIKNPEIDIVGSYVQDIDSEGNKLKIVKYPENHKKCYSRFAYRDPVAHPSVMFRRRYFLKAGMYNKKYRKNQDSILWMNGFLKGCLFANIPQVLLYFRTDNDFYKMRRGGFEKAKEILKLRIRINRKMKYGLNAYIYTIIIFIIRLLPDSILRIFYSKR